MCTKKYTQTLTISFSFFFTQTLNNVLWVAPFCLCDALLFDCDQQTTDDAGQKNDAGQKDDGEEEGGSDQTSQD